jgi:uncharacterized protein with PQ loop repeat
MPTTYISSPRNDAGQAARMLRVVFVTSAGIAGNVYCTCAGLPQKHTKTKTKNILGAITHKSFCIIITPIHILLAYNWLLGIMALIFSTWNLTTLFLTFKN